MEDTIQQNEKKHKEEIQQKDNMLQKKDDNLQQLANLLLKNGYTKEQIFKETGIEL